MRHYGSISVRFENGLYRVPADFVDGFNLAPLPEGFLNLTFWDDRRMKEFLKTHGYEPSVIEITTQ